MVILNYFFYFQCFPFHAHVLTSFLSLLDVAWVNKVLLLLLLLLLCKQMRIKKTTIGLSSSRLPVRQRFQVLKTCFDRTNCHRKRVHCESEFEY